MFLYNILCIIIIVKPKYFAIIGKDACFMELSTSEIGQGILEYGFILILVSVVSIVILEILGFSVFDLFEYAIVNLGEAFA